MDCAIRDRVARGGRPWGTGALGRCGRFNGVHARLERSSVLCGWLACGAELVGGLRWFDDHRGFYGGVSVMGGVFLIGRAPFDRGA